ncbi:MAG: PAS domain-containing protein [Sphingobium sp.]|nr:PAS domain-containing protein [Sphingobium sp.]
MRLWFDRTVWIVLAAVLSGTAAVFALTASVEATAASALAGLVALAMLYDAVERGTIHASPSPAEPAAPADPDVGADEELALLIEAMPEPLLVVHRGRVEQCNAASLALLGAHIKGEDIRLALRHPAAIDLLKRALAGPGAERVDIAGLGAPEQLWELTVHPLSRQRLLLLLTDRSGRQAAEKMRVDFVANASHELRTPLAGILGFIETLRDPVAGSDAATRERFLGIMDGEARRMQRLVDDLMSLSRIEAEKYHLPNQPVAIKPLADEVVQVFRQSQNKHAHDIVVAIDPDLPPLCGDRAQLSQILHNLISNALKYGAPGTEIGVAARLLPHDMVELSVSDHGDGIAPEHLPRLTERFYRVDSSRSRAMGGTGLGLAIVKHIVQRHRGLLHLDSKLGQGTTVRVELPVFVGTTRRPDQAGADGA